MARDVVTLSTTRKAEAKHVVASPCEVTHQQTGEYPARLLTESHHNRGYCSCGDFNTLPLIADSVAQCIKAAREELRPGAHCIRSLARVESLQRQIPIWMKCDPCNRERTD
jgi:hypothetical protein